MSEKIAKLEINGETYELPIVEGTCGDQAIDIRTLLRDTGYTTLDSGYMNTASCSSSITYLDGKKGILRYRGYDIEDLAENCQFIEVAYLLLTGELPDEDQLEVFKIDMKRFALIHEDMIHFLIISLPMLHQCQFSRPWSIRFITSILKW